MTEGAEQQAREMLADGNLAFQQEHYAQAQAAYAGAASLFRERGDARNLATSLSRLGLALAKTQRFRPGLEALEEAIQVYEQNGDAPGAGAATVWLGEALLAQGQPFQARDAFHRAAVRLDAAGDANQAAQARQNGDALSRALPATLSPEAQRKYDAHYALLKREDAFGQQYHRMERLDLAEAAWRTALEASQALGFGIESARLHSLVGEVTARQGRLSEGLSHFRRVLELAEQFAPHTLDAEEIRVWVRLEAESWWNLGYVYFDQRDIDAALQHFSRAINVYRYMGAQLQIARVRSMMGAAYAAGGDVAQAVPLLSDVVAAFRDMGRAPEADRAAGWLERARAGDRLDDLFVFSPPREGADVHDVTSPEAFVRRYREAQESLGARQYDRAAAILEELLILARQRDAEEVEAELLISLGFSYRRLDRPSEALLAYQEALAAARRHGDREREARALNNLGVVYASLNQKEEALGYLQAAARIRETFDDKQEWGETLVSLAAISSEPEARELLTQALAHLDPDRQPSAWVAAYRDLKRSLEGKALDAFLRTHRATAQSLGIDTEQPAQTGQRFERIQPVRGEGLEFALVMQAPEERHRTGEGDVAARQASAEMLVLLGMKDAAVAELQAALEIVERLRSQISSAADRERAFAGQWQIYDRLIGLLIEAERFPEALETIERVKTRSLLDLLHQIDHLPPGVPDELRARYRRLRLDQRQKERQLADAQASPSAGRSESLEVARQEFLKAGLALEEVLQQVRLYAPEVDPGQPFPVVGFAEMQALVRSPAHAFVVYWLGRQAQGVLVVSKGELVFRSLERVGELGAAVEEYQRLLAAGMDAGTEGDFRSLLGRLYPILIQPIAAEMEGLEDITFIPHHTLHLLPLHALDDGCQTLIDRYTIDYAPSFSLLQVCRDHKRQAAASQRLLLVDNPDGSLDYAAVEAGQVRRLFGEAHVLPGQAGTARAIGQHLPAAAYSHFACHGDFQPDRPDRIALVVAQEGEHTGYLTREEILTRFRAAYGSTVVLSACNSGRTLLGATDEFVGLPSAFLIAGASAVVGSLWPVYDVSTALLMGEFYRWHLGVGEDVTPPLAPAAALRAAQRWLRGATAGELAVRFQAERGAPESERSMPYALASALWGRFAALEPGARPFEQPVYWAAFTCTGA